LVIPNIVVPSTPRCHAGEAGETLVALPCRLISDSHRLQCSRWSQLQLTSVRATLARTRSDNSGVRSNAKASNCACNDAASLARFWGRQQRIVVLEPISDMHFDWNASTRRLVRKNHDIGVVQIMRG